MKNSNFIILSLIFATTIGCRLFESEWDRTQRINTIDGYEQFIARNPESPFVKQAKENIKSLEEKHDWEKALKSDTIDAYKEFIKKWPESSRKEDVAQAIEKLFTSVKGTIQVLMGFGGQGESGRIKLGYSSLQLTTNDGLVYSIRLMPDFEYIDHTGKHPRDESNIALSLGGTYHLKGIVINLQDVRKEYKNAGGRGIYYPSAENSKKFFDVYVMELLEDNPSN